MAAITDPGSVGSLTPVPGSHWGLGSDAPMGSALSWSFVAASRREFAPAQAVTPAAAVISSGQTDVAPAAAATASPAASGSVRGTATVLLDVWVRNVPTTVGNTPVAQYLRGMKFNYDSYVDNAGYRWLSYVSYSGVRRYVAQQTLDGKTFYVSGGVPLSSQSPPPNTTNPGSGQIRGRVLGDDYPASLKKPGLNAVVDPWRFYNRNCTSFVAWRMNNANGVAFSNGMKGGWFDHAYNWDDNARNLGYVVNDIPAVGAIAYDKNGNSKNFGHVAWVAVVDGNKVTVEEYNKIVNGVQDGAYHVRTVDKSTFGYIHIKDIG